MKKIAILVLAIALIASTLSIAFGAGSHPGIPHDGDGKIYAQKRTNIVRQLDDFMGKSYHTRAYNTKLKCSLCGYYWTYIYDPEPHTFKNGKCTACGYKK